MEKLEEAIKELGYVDEQHLEANLENNPEFIKWWDVIKKLAAWKQKQSGDLSS